MKKTKIDWCDCTINPVVGCPRGCEYCYARNMNDRFKWVKDFSKPQFFFERLRLLESKTPKSVFMNSMSDIEYWTDEQAEATVRAIKENKQHRYIFLTKASAVPYPLFFYYTFEQNAKERSVLNKKTTDAIEGQNVYLGKTITTQSDIVFNDYYNFDFWSIEPIHGEIVLDAKIGSYNLRQIIIGAETGNRKGKVIPEVGWVRDIVKQCDSHGAAVFMKESLRSIMGADFRQDELIWRIKK